MICSIWRAFLGALVEAGMNGVEGRHVVQGGGGGWERKGARVVLSPCGVGVETLRGGGSHVPCGPHLCAFFLECRFYAMIQMETLF